MYGRYDNYRLPVDADDISENILGQTSYEEADSVRRKNRAVRLCDLAGQTHADIPPAVQQPHSGRKTVEAMRNGQSPAPASSPGRADRPDCVSPSIAFDRNKTGEVSSRLMATGGWMITRISPTEEGAFVLISLEGRTEGGARMRRKIPVTVEQYTDLELQVGELSETQYDRLVEAGLYCRAIRKGMEMLGYGDLSVRRLVWKLTARGVDQATAQAAADYLKTCGYLSEKTAACRRAVQGASKLWGPRRIMQDLRAQGYTDEAVTAAMEALSAGEDPWQTVDFEAMCASLIRKKYGHVPEDRGERQRMVAALMRMGYTTEQIREAARHLTDS